MLGALLLRRQVALRGIQRKWLSGLRQLPFAMFLPREPLNI